MSADEPAAAAPSVEEIVQEDQQFVQTRVVVFTVIFPLKGKIDLQVYSLDPRTYLE